MDQLQRLHKGHPMREPVTADSHSLRDVFASHRLAFISTAERITGCRSQAEDIVQDAFLKLIGTTITDSIRSQASYLTTVVRNLAIDHYRKKCMELRLLATEEEGQGVSEPEATSPESINLHRQILQTIDVALSELPERTRYAFEMHRIHGFSQKDIATTLGVSPTLVNFMIRDALVHCRKTMKRMER
jgi:RNA polymerase sigma factor (sigma-70 family)